MIIVLQAQVNGSDFSGKLFLPGVLCLLFFQCIQALLKQYFCGGFFFFGFGKIFFGFLPGFCFGQQGHGFFQCGICFLQIAFQNVPQCGIGFQERVQSGQDFFNGKTAFLCLPDHVRVFRIFTAEDTVHVLADAVPDVLPLVLDPVCLLAQLILEFHIQIGVEDIPEDLLPFLGVGKKQLQEVALGNHGHLSELFPVKTQNLPDGGIDFFGLGHQIAVGVRQGRAGGLLGHSFALILAFGLGTHIFGIPGDCVFLASISEHKRDFRGRSRVSIFGAEHTGFPVAAAGFAEEGEADGIKNGGLARTGVTGDEIQSAGAQGFKVQFHDPCVGTEGGQSQFQRSHLLSSQMDSISSRMKSF